MPNTPTRISKSFRLSPASVAKLRWLGSRYGTQTSALEVAIDRLYVAEKANCCPTHPQRSIPSSP